MQILFFRQLRLPPILRSYYISFRSYYTSLTWNWNWCRNRSTKSLIPKYLSLLIITSVAFLAIIYISAENSPRTNIFSDPIYYRSLDAFDCYAAPQARPLIANAVEGIKFPYLYSLSVSDMGNYPDNPHRNIVRTLKKKPFRKPDISATVQEVLDKMKTEMRAGVFVDVGAHVGIATFAAAAMGFRVVAFEPIYENIQKICDGIYLNRVGELVRVFEAAVADRPGYMNITVNKLVRVIRIDDVIRPYEPVAVLKIGVEGWEHNVLKGAIRLLSRRKWDAPYLIYEEDDRLLEASNSSAQEIRGFLNSLGYNRCVQHGNDAHCTKT